MLDEKVPVVLFRVKVVLDFMPGFLLAFLLVCRSLFGEERVKLFQNPVLVG